MTTMNVSDDLKSRLKFTNNANINADIFKKLLENVFSTLIDNKELHSITTLYNSKPDLIKSVFASLLTIAAEFARHNSDQVYTKKFLIDHCNFNQDKAVVFSELYNKHKQKLQIKLGCVGSHLPHIVDVKWKIDYIVKSNNSDQFEGPLFRISLITSSFDHAGGNPKNENINFSCNSQELQDLVHKLKDAVRHCQRIATKH